jgi:hypothetical protein
LRRCQQGLDDSDHSGDWQADLAACTNTLDLGCHLADEPREDIGPGEDRVDSPPVKPIGAAAGRVEQHLDLGVEPENGEFQNWHG